MATKIEFDYSGEHYTLEFDALSAKKTVKEYKIDLDNISSEMLSLPEDLFMGACIKHHPNLTKEKAHEMYIALSPTAEGSEEGGENEVFSALLQMFTEAVNNIARPSGNAKWKVTK